MTLSMSLNCLIETLLNIFIMAFNPEVALFNLLEDAQTADELLAVIDDYLTDDVEV